MGVLNGGRSTALAWPDRSPERGDFGAFGRTSCEACESGTAALEWRACGARVEPNGDRAVRERRASSARVARRRQSGVRAASGRRPSGAWRQNRHCSSAVRFLSIVPNSIVPFRGRSRATRRPAHVPPKCRPRARNLPANHMPPTCCPLAAYVPSNCRPRATHLGCAWAARGRCVGDA